MSERFDPEQAFRPDMIEGELMGVPVAATITEKVRSFNFRKNDVYAFMFDLAPQLVREAQRSAIELQDSDRGFGVGAAAFGYDMSEERPRVAQYVAGNFKSHLYGVHEPGVDLDDVPKLCAEANILIHAEHRQLQRIGLIVVASTVNELRIRGVSRVPAPTLDPCDDCGDTFEASPLIDPDTVIMTVGAGINEYRIQRPAEYQKRRKLSKPDRRGIKPYHEHEWEMKKMAYEIELERSRLNTPDSRGDIEIDSRRRFLAAEMMVNG